MLRQIFAPIVLLFLLNNPYTISAQCNAPTLSVFDIVADSATISWVPVGAVLDYEYAVQPASAPQPATGTSILTTNIRVGGLAPGTAYKAWLKANCTASISSPWTSITFSTTPCGTPSTINISNVKGDSADIVWTSVNPGANYQYYVDTFNTTPTSGTNIATNSIRVKSLLPAKTYYVFVRTVCGISSYSPWSSSQSFFTPFPTSINTSNQSLKVTAYPNPVSGILNVNPVNNHKGMVTVYNSVGTVISSTEIHTEPVQFDMSSQPDGVYLLRYSCETGISVTKILKR